MPSPARRWAGESAMRVILAIVLSALSCFGQTFTQRGFLETRGTFYPREAVNDSAHAVGEALFRYESFYRPSPAFQLAGAVDFRTDTHRQVEREFHFSWWDREIRQPIGDVRR